MRRPVHSQRRGAAATTADVTEGAQTIIHCAPSSLTPYARNARVHSRKQVRQIADSIERFGFTNPVLIDDDGMILAGHGRVEAALLLGLDRVPCVRLAAMSPAQKRAYVLADNKLALNAGWDEDILADELQLILDCGEVDVGATGFAIAEVDLLLGPCGTDDATLSDEDDRLPPIPDGATATTRPGDLWQLGPHRMICGDARDEAVYAQLLSSPVTEDELGDRDGTTPTLPAPFTAAPGALEQAQLVFTDPPYNVPVTGHILGRGKVRHREFAMASGEMDSAAFTAFLGAVFERLVAHTLDGSIHFVCMDWRHLAEMLSAGRSHYTTLKNLIVWVKDHGGMGSFYRSRHELVFAFKNREAPHVNAFELGQHGRHRTNVWNYRGVNAPSASSREALAMHPDGKTGRDAGRRHARLLAARRAGARCVLWIGDRSRGRAQDWSPSPRDRDRPAILRHGDPAVAGVRQG